MEIDIKIKLEDADIGLLIKSLFEIIKKLPQDNIKVETKSDTKPPDQINSILTNTIDGMVHYKDISTNYTKDIKPDMNTFSDEPLYYSNGTSVKKIDSEKKNEV